mmetsp:Transcript_677/g.1577  ORF Transcript_677/g.1577 Transcript_677/m.1577 type:complete len:203 (-) Transcript_677:167-775(-)
MLLALTASSPVAATGCSGTLRRSITRSTCVAPARLKPRVTTEPGGPSMRFVKKLIGLRYTSTPSTSTIQSPTRIWPDRSAGSPSCSCRTKSAPVASLRKMSPTPTSGCPGRHRCSATWMRGVRGSVPLCSPSRTVEPGGPSKIRLTSSTGFRNTSRPFISHKQSPTLISPLRAAGSPSFNLLTYNVPSSSGWKTIPTPTTSF